MKTPICDFVKAYGESNAVRLHMPGHKGVSRLGCEALDITEIGGADVLYHSSGIIRESENKESRLIKDAIAHIDANLDRALTIRELSGLLYCSESTLNHIFKKEMNVPIKQYVLDKKMAAAIKPP